MVAAKGPFTIGGEIYETDKDGRIIITTPHQQAVVRQPTKDRVQRMLNNKILVRDDLLQQIEEATADCQVCEQEIADLEILLANAGENPRGNR